MQNHKSRCRWLTAHLNVKLPDNGLIKLPGSLYKSVHVSSWKMCLLEHKFAKGKHN